MNDASTERQRILDPVDRISEALFGLIMAVTIVGSLSIASAGRNEVRTVLVAALGCNLAWGLVDAVMYLIRTVVDRGRTLTLLHSVRSANAPGGRSLVETALSRMATAGVVSPLEIEAIRGRIVALPAVPARARLERGDLTAALAIFLLVVLATFPVVLPFALMHDVGAAKNASRGIAIAMLFLGGFALGRYAGYGSWRAGFVMTALGVLLVGAIMALGG